MAIWTTTSKHKSHLICFILFVIVLLIFRTMIKGVYFANGEPRNVEYGKVFFVEMQYMGAQD